jgi:hypothetical protein
MAYSKVSIPREVYHFTQKQNLEQILEDKKIRCFGDTECWFSRTLEDMLRYMDMTVMNEGQRYIAPDRTIKRYPKFKPENYVMLCLVPARWEDKWYKWNQELPANASPEARQQAREFSELKLGYRGDLRFSEVEVFEMTEVMGIDSVQDTAFPNLTM